MIIVSKSRRKRINLSIDSEVWAKCSEKGKKFGLNWSQIAEEAFVNVLLHMNELEKILDSIPPELQASVAKTKLKDLIEQSYTQLNQELEENIPEPKSESKK